MSKTKVQNIKSEIRRAETLVRYWDRKLTVALRDITSSSSTLATNAPIVKTKYTKLKKLI